MFEWIINGDIRVSTIFRLIARNWDLIGIVFLFFIALFFGAVNRIRSKKED